MKHQIQPVRTTGPTKLHGAHFSILTLAYNSVKDGLQLLDADLHILEERKK